MCVRNKIEGSRNQDDRPRKLFIDVTSFLASCINASPVPRAVESPPPSPPSQILVRRTKGGKINISIQLFMNILGNLGKTGRGGPDPSWQAASNKQPERGERGDGGGARLQGERWETD